MKFKDNAINRDPQEFQDPQRLLRRKLTFFAFLVMVYDGVDDADKFSKKNCFCFHCIFTGDVSSIANKCDLCIL